jgi:hypothetical protein
MGRFGIHVTGLIFGAMSRHVGEREEGGKDWKEGGRGRVSEGCLVGCFALPDTAATMYVVDDLTRGVMLLWTDLEEQSVPCGAEQFGPGMADGPWLYLWVTLYCA